MRKKILDISQVEASQKDIKRKIKIPKVLNEELAELIGIHIGDGCVHEFKSIANQGVRTVISYSGDSKGDREYYEEFVAPLLQKLFRIGLSFQEYDTFFDARLWSKAIYSFYTTSIGLPSGMKSSTVVIPKIILNSSQQIITKFLRGLFDTDGSLVFKRKSKNRHNYPVIKINLRSKELIKQLAKILRDLGFIIYVDFDVKRFDKRTNKYTTIHEIYLNGKGNLNLWMKIIGFKNKKHLTKYFIWKKFGFCPPQTSLSQRKDILKGKINPNVFYYNALVAQHG